MPTVELAVVSQYAGNSRIHFEPRAGAKWANGSMSNARCTGVRLRDALVDDVVISAITYAELQFGVAASADPERERANFANLIEDIPVAPFDANAGIAYGPLRLATRDSRADHLDKLIAAHAAALGVTVVTNNVQRDNYEGRLPTIRLAKSGCRRVAIRTLFV